VLVGIYLLKRIRFSLHAACLQMTPPGVRSVSPDHPPCNEAPQFLPEFCPSTISLPCVSFIKAERVLIFSYAEFTLRTRGVLHHEEKIGICSIALVSVPRERWRGLSTLTQWVTATQLRLLRIFGCKFVADAVE
jgi:hypothetical protein